MTFDVLFATNGNVQLHKKKLKKIDDDDEDVF